MAIQNNRPPINDAEAQLLAAQRTVDALTLLQGFMSDKSSLKNLSQQIADAYQVPQDAQDKYDALFKQASDAQVQIDKLSAAQANFAAQQQAFNDAQAPALKAIQDATDAQSAIYDKKIKAISDAQSALDAEQNDINNQNTKLASDKLDLQQALDALDVREASVAAREDAIAKAKAALS